MQVCAAMCNILAAVLAKTPKGALRSKFAASSQILMRVAEQHLPEVASPLHMTMPLSMRIITDCQACHCESPSQGTLLPGPMLIRALAVGV